jgi:hypothetical protein
MADGDGIFTQLGRMFEKGVAFVIKKDEQINAAFENAVGKEFDAEHALVHKAELSLAHGLNTGAAFLNKNVAEDEASLAQQHIQGGESVHEAPKALETPSVPKTGKGSKVTVI